MSVETPNRVCSAAVPGIDAPYRRDRQPRGGHVMSGMRRRLQALGIAAVLLSLCVTAAAPGGRAGAQGSRDRAQDRLAAAAHDARGEAQPADAALRRSDEGAPRGGREGVGSVFSETDPVLINKYQRAAVEESRLGIPILFAFDTIHGFRTIFPIPLGYRQQLRSGRRQGRPPHRGLRVGRGGPQADLQPDGRPLARAALGPDLRGGGRGSPTSTRSWPRRASRAHRAATTARRTRS